MKMIYKGDIIVLKAKDYMTTAKWELDDVYWNLLY